MTVEDTDKEHRAIEDTFILGDQPYVYTEQDWNAVPGAAAEAFHETRRNYWKYMTGVLSDRLIFEDGRPLTRTELHNRAIELVGGMFALSTHAHVTIPLVRRTINGMLLVCGIHLGLDPT